MSEPRAVLTPPSSQHLPELDSIRGLAALVVLLEHTTSAFNWSFATPWTQWPLIGAAFDGAAAVTIFFVLSGFVLSRPYVARVSARPRLETANFYLRRITRVWLPWACVFACSLVAKEAFFSDAANAQPSVSSWLVSFWHEPLSLRDVVRQGLFLDEDLKFAPLRLVPQDWSLAVEMKASLMMPLLILMARRNVWMLVLSGTALLALFETGQDYLSFVIGVLLARYLDEILALARRLDRRVLLLLAVGAIAAYQSRLVLSHYRYVDFPVEKLTWTTTSLGSAALIVFALLSARAGSLLRSRPFVWLGKVSFSVYLVQMLVLIWLVPQIVLVLNRGGLQRGPLLASLIFALSVSLTLGLAWVLHRRVEMPCIALGKRLTEWLRSRTVPKAGPLAA